jgi:hypothetical protein
LVFAPELQRLKFSLYICIWQYDSGGGSGDEDNDDDDTHDDEKVTGMQYYTCLYFIQRNALKNVTTYCIYHQFLLYI